MQFWDELKRRKVFRVAVVYAATAFALLQAADLILPRLGVPDWGLTLIIVMTLVGFPLALVLAWAFDLTPGGLRATSDAPANVDEHSSSSPALGVRTMLVAGALVVLGVGLGAGWFLKPAAPTVIAAQRDAPQKSVAVLPFVALSSGADDEYFADGLTEEILNSLAALPELLVTARTSAFHFKGQDLPVPEIAKALGVRHVVEGSVRRSGEQLRITAQLIRASDGFHLWSNTYDREQRDVFAVQEDIARSIAEALDLVLDEEKLARMQQTGVRDVEAFIAFQKGMQLYHQAHADFSTRNAVLARASAHFEDAFTRVPTFMAAHLFHADLPSHRVMDAARDLPSEQLTDTEVAQLSRAMHERLQAAHRSAATPDQRASASFSLKIMSDDWRGLKEAAEQLFAVETCVHVLYSYLMNVLGYAREMVGLQTKLSACDPLDPEVVTTRLTSMIWNGESRGVLPFADELEQRIGSHHWLVQDRVLYHVGTGDFVKARAGLASPAMIMAERDEWNVAISAAEGRIAEARAAAAKWSQDHGSDAGRTIRFAAWLGDRDSANAVAARVDQRELGPLVLVSITELCRCGTPFDLAATPRLQARLTEAGLPWPPRTLIKFPQKSW